MCRIMVCRSFVAILLDLFLSSRYGLVKHVAIRGVHPLKIVFILCLAFGLSYRWVKDYTSLQTYRTTRLA